MKRTCFGLLAAAAMSLLATPCLAKCTVARYEFAGTVVGADGEPVADATVLLFLNGGSVPLSDSLEAPIRSSPRGDFRAMAHISTYSGPGLFLPERCNWQPRLIEVIVVAGTAAQRFSFQAASVRRARANQAPLFDVGTLRLCVIGRTPPNGCDASPNPSLQRTPPG